MPEEKSSKSQGSNFQNDASSLHESQPGAENNNPKHKDKSHILKLILLGVIAILIIAVIGGAYFFGKNSNKINSINTSPSPPSDQNNQTVCAQDVFECPDGSFVSRQGPKCKFAACPTGNGESSTTLDKTYTSTTGGWQIDYPSSLTVKEYPSTQIGNNGVGTVTVFQKIGPTQSEGTEFYDGISMTIGEVKKDPNDTINEAADKQTAPQDPDVSSRSALKEISINNLSGYETTITGLGSFRVVMLENPDKTNRAYYISIFAEGPGSSKTEYEKIASDMLAGFRNVN